MRFKPRIGDEFPLTEKVIDAKSRHLAEFTRSTIALCVIIASLLALLLAAVLGWRAGDFGYLRTAWDVVAFPAGAVVTFYFRWKDRE
jgi:hypothetical protein